LSGLRVLVTNTQLDKFSGTEVVVRDLALELQRQGHIPMVYSPRPGAMAMTIKSAGVEVTDDLASLSFAPDVVHGHHHPETIEALLQFPSVPGIFVCHDATAALDEPPPFPRIFRYVGVDNRCRKRLAATAGISEDKIEVVLNAVDLRRFLPRERLPSRPKRALVFSNNASASTHLTVVRRACRQLGMQLDVMGENAGKAVVNPETFLPHYDLVFAKARCALEAMACGCAVILCDTMGAGPLVTSENFDQLRPMNFGAGVLLQSLRPENLVAQAELYNADDAAGVSQRIRKEASLELAVHRWLEIYGDVMQESSEMGRDCQSESLALARYLRRWNYQRGVLEERRRFHRRIDEIPLIGKYLPGLRRRVRRFL
jgi:glycosyltransferase involved in cell wall biosynthesis